MTIFSLWEDSPLTVIKGKNVILRPLKESDIPILYRYIYGKEHTEWKKYDAPYYPLEPMSLEAFVSAMEKHLRKKEPPGRMIIEHLGEAIGTVNYYWEDESTRWLEAGIVIYPSRFWSRGLGTEALALWIDYLFQHLEIARVGLTTWSGNPRMIRAAEKLGMKMEGRLRKCRYYQGVYYDSIRMGILREEWEEAKKELPFFQNRPASR